MEHVPIVSRRTASGFTLIEIILYIGLSGLLLSAIFPFSMNLFEMFARADAERETAVAARSIAEEIVSGIRSAGGIDRESSVFGVDDGRLVLDRVGTSDQTVMDVSDGIIRFRTGAADPVPIHRSSVRVTRLVFDDRSSDDRSTQHVDFSFTVETADSGSKSDEYRSDIRIDAGAEVRNNTL